MQSQFVSKLPKMAMFVMVACALAAVNSTAWAVHSNEKNERDEGKSCSNQTLHGDYGLTIEGLLNIPGPGTQIRGVVMQTYDGNGHITQVDHIVVDGTPPPLPWTPGSGTYTVNSDCTGKATIIVPSSPAPPLVLYFVVVNQGKEIRQVVEGNAVTATGRRVR
jgi:hypothetical protein